MINPYKIEGPALISFSGGRTSGFMLHNIIQAHGGKLPDDIHVVFANTGKEAPETLDFVNDIAKKWDINIHWLELYFGDERPIYRTKRSHTKQHQEMVSPLKHCLIIENIYPTQ